MKKAYINSLSLLKLLAVLGIIGCHTSMIKTFDACGRCVELLFLASGFLMAYNHFSDKQEQTWWQAVIQKLPRLYPIHLVCFLLQAIFVVTWATKPLSYFLTVGILNLTLQQAWFIPTEFSYNNVSWYLSALVFAYAMTPAIKDGVKRAIAKKYGLLALFIGIAIIRYYCEYLAVNAIRYVSIDVHCNPFVQMLNYALGYITAVAFMQKNVFNTTLKEVLPTWQVTILQILVMILYVLCCNRFAENTRVFFVIIALPVFYVLAIDRGIIRSIGGWMPVRFFADMTLEIFMLHSFILYKLPVAAEEPMSFVIFFATTMMAATAFHLAYRLIVKLLTKK